MSPINVEITARGQVSSRLRARAEHRISRLEGFTKGPLLGARVVLTQEANPRIAAPSRAEAEIDLQGRLIRAQAAAPAMDAAVDEMVERLQRQLRRYVDRRASAGRHPAAAPGGRPNRSRAPAGRPGVVHPDEERQIIRRKSFSFGPMSVDEAADALEDLDHDFFLFHDDDSDADAVVYWRDDGLLALIEPAWATPADERGPVHEVSRFSSSIDLATAVAEMDAVGHRFLFFYNVDTARGNVIYRRYDGHYGLIEPA